MIDISQEQQASDVIERFNEAWNDHNLDSAIAFLSDGCVFENTSPGPDGERFVGKDAIREAWQPVFDTPGMYFEVEEAIACGDRLFSRWRYHWTNGDGQQMSIRGADFFRVFDGKIVEKLSYVKG
jgi:ketosteroid isomerase-like protein